jgi:hypothetical protein
MAPEEECSEAEIESARSQWARRQRDKHRRFFGRLQRWAGISFHTSAKFMDYLHGDVRPEEAENACSYEYARESRTLWHAAHERDNTVRRMRSCFSFSLAIQRSERVFYAHAASSALRHMRRRPLLLKAPADGRLRVTQRNLPSWSWPKVPQWAHRFLNLKSFPYVDWLELSEKERQEFRRPVAPPLPMTDVLTLEALGVFDRFKALAKANEPVIEEVPLGAKGKPMPADVLPLLQAYADHPIYHALVNVDFSKTENQLVNEFKAWLRLPDNQQRLEKHRKVNLAEWRYSG